MRQHTRAHRRAVGLAIAVQVLPFIILAWIVYVLWRGPSWSDIVWMVAGGAVALLILIGWWLHKRGGHRH